MHHQIWRKARMCFAAQELYEEKCSEAIFTNNFLSWGNLTEVKDDDSNDDDDDDDDDDTGCRQMATITVELNTHDTRSTNWRHKSTSFLSGPGCWYVCQANLGPYSYGTRFRRRLEHCSIPTQKVACTRLRNTAQNYIINVVH